MKTLAFIYSDSSSGNIFFFLQIVCITINYKINENLEKISQCYPRSLMCFLQIIDQSTNKFCSILHNIINMSRWEKTPQNSMTLILNRPHSDKYKPSRELIVMSGGWRNHNKNTLKQATISGQTCQWPLGGLWLPPTSSASLGQHKIASVMHCHSTTCNAVLQAALQHSL